MRNTSMTPKEILNLAEKMLSDVESRSGGVLYSGWDTLAPGNLYVMGFNPGGEAEGPKAEAGTIGQSLQNEKWDWSSYADEDYGPSGPNQFQVRVRKVFEEIGADPRRTLSTNAVFARSKNAEALTGAWQLWWERCWPVHQLFLHVVRPRVIICLGNGQKGSPWAMLRLTKKKEGGAYSPNWVDPDNNEPNSDFTAGRIQTDVCFDLGDYGKHSCMVLGLAHPSRWAPLDAAKEKLALARARIVSWNRPTRQADLAGYV